jgi:protein gp37
MSLKSNIEWTESTWNPTTGCTKISDGCDNCYAYIMANRLKNMGNIRYKEGFNLTLHNDLIKFPLTWKKGRNIFVNSMSDIFHEEIPLEFLEKIFTTMNQAYWHRFQLLTKRAEKMFNIYKHFKWTNNIWLGVTIESEKYLNRIEYLKKIPARVKFVSFEPLLSDFTELNLTGIDWVIVGGESGAGSRKIEERWVLNIRDICIKNNIPFFFKQWGGFNKKKNGCLLEGKVWNEYPQIDNDNEPKQMTIDI